MEKGHYFLKSKVIFMAVLSFHFVVNWLIADQNDSCSPPQVHKEFSDLFWWKNITFHKDYEIARREGQKTTWEQFLEFKSFVHKSHSERSDSLHQIQEQFYEVLARHELLRELDGYDTYRQKLTQFTSDLIQAKLWQNQNPEKCSNAKTLVCYFNTHRNGWGCMVHHAAYCLMAALASGRMLVIDKTEEVFGLEHHFLPLSRNCGNQKVPKTPYDWPTPTNSEPVVKFCPNRLSKSQEVHLGQFNTSMYPYLPSELIDLITWISPDPEAWFVGQFIKYLLRPKPWLQKELNVLNQLHPGLAIQVRRQDKYREISFVEVGKYVEVINDYFNIQEVKRRKVIHKRKVFVATDEPNILTELNLRFPNIDWLTLKGTSESSIFKTRYSPQGQEAIIKDVFLLAQSDFLVCTFSSNVCRLAYELRLALKPFVSNLHEVISLDIDYFYQYGHQVEYVAKHKRLQGSYKGSNQELTFNKGDVIQLPVVITTANIARNTGTNLRTGSKGHFIKSMLSRRYLISETYPSFMQ